MRPVIWLSLVVVLCSCNQQKSDTEKSAIPVRLTSIETYTPSAGEKYSASIAPKRQVNLSFKVNGFVDFLYQLPSARGGHHTVDIGDVVNQGTVLAHLRTKDYQLQVSQASGQMQQARDSQQTARAQLDQAEAAALDAQQNFDRAEALFRDKSLTKSDYDSAKANRDSTRAQVEAAKSQVQASGAALTTSQAAVGTASLALHDTSLAAPFTAVIVQRAVELGTLAGPGMVAFVLADISSVKATFGVSDLTVSGLKTGWPLSVYTEAFPSRQFRGHVSAIAAVADSSTRSFQVEVTIPNEHALLRPGMIASLDIQTVPKGSSVTVAPLSAIVPQAQNSSRFAVVVVEDGMARHRPVSLGETYGDVIAISGISRGAKVVSSGASFVRDGDAVKVIP
ncbi:MAG: efflux RND transporter periplasmic adaptor subunit [Acidobacteriaceae bacterium]|nr:efflux RND transporter periplasmic adaptor subunit [Acidobacteriaceae bacterium]